MIDLRERFSQFSRPSYFTRVDDTHVLELHIGLDQKGRKTLKLRGNFSPIVVKGTGAIDISQYKTDLYQTIQFSLVEHSMAGLFYHFCEDMIESSRNLKVPEEGYGFLVSRYQGWKKMFFSSKKNTLSEIEQMGLIGELLFLKNFMFTHYSQHESLESWTGQEKTHKDFSFEKRWYEVKATTKNANVVKISSIEQLESDNEGELVVFFLEKMSPVFSGIKLNDLVFEIRKLISDVDALSIFENKISYQGYEYNDIYDENCFSLIDMKRFNVDKDFPRLLRKNIPVAISKIQYDLLLAEILPFEVK